MKSKSEIIRTPCSPEDSRAIKAIVGVTFVPGIPTKHLVLNYLAHQTIGIMELQ